MEATALPYHLGQGHRAANKVVQRQDSSRYNYQRRSSLDAHLLYGLGQAVPSCRQLRLHLGMHLVHDDLQVEEEAGNDKACVLGRDLGLHLAHDGLWQEVACVKGLHLKE